MTLLYADPRFLEHETGQHPERAERLRRSEAHLREAGWFERCRRPEWQPATVDDLARVHAREYPGEIELYAQRGGGRIEADTVVSPRSSEVARLAAGAAVDAVARVLAGPDRRALCLVRPPGHHALAASAMGFCLFNNVAVAAAAALERHQLDRVLIVDFDVHHGNGTQDAFWESDRVGFLSIHRWPFYPGSGAATETGAGRGLGYTVNLPVEFGTPRRDYHAQFAAAVERLATKMRPQLVLVSAGFDAHRSDPIGSLGLETEDFAELTRVVVAAAQAHAEGRLVSLLEGGYNVDVLGPSIAAHLDVLAEPPPAAGN